jgi:hypothetical protein
MSEFRSLLFIVFQLIVTPIWAVLVLLVFWLPPIARYKFIIVWCRANLLGARWICGIRHQVIGAENIPRSSEPHIVMSKHSSTWKRWRSTFFSTPGFCRQEGLLSIPFFRLGVRARIADHHRPRSGQDAMSADRHPGPRALRPGFLDRRLSGRNANQGWYARPLQIRRSAARHRPRCGYCAGGA